MKLDQDTQLELLNDVLSHRFSDADDLVHYVQNRIGKLDGSIITTYWLGKEHMINDKHTLRAYIKFECDRWFDAKIT
mgnify:CR=1 FL=1